jgi:hypothetical protein
MPRGGIKKSTWKKGEKPPVKRPKGSKNKKTLLKEALGLKSWDQLKEFVESNGIEKCILEIQKLRGAAYVYAFLSLTEYVKPKLARTEVKVDPESEVHVNVSEKLTYEQLYQLKYGHAPKKKK